MDFQQDVRVFCNQDISDMEKKLEINSGVISAQNLKEKTPENYFDLAHVPNQDWYPLTHGTMPRLIFTQGNEPKEGSCVGLLRIPDDVLSPLSQLISQFSTTTEAIAHPDYEKSVQVILTYLKPWYKSPANLAIHNVAYKSSGLLTATFDARRGAYIGLHVDNWDKQPFGKTSSARTRISINLGQYDRFFLFYNLTLQTMFDLMNISTLELEGKYPRTNLNQAVGYEFMRRYPEYPVTRLRIAPKEAYIAPTENLFHDGSSIGQLGQDITLTIRGHFRWA